MEDEKKTVGYEDIIRMLADNYMKLEQSIANQILLDVSNHYPTQGSYRENVWKTLFEMIVPKKYCIEQSVFIIDSYGNKSKEVDLAIFDEMYTPYIFNYGEIKFIPIEAVAAVVQCKSKSVDYADVSGWRESIEALFTSMDSVARTASSMTDNLEPTPMPVTQTATRPIMILCAIEPINKISVLIEEFDIILSVSEIGEVKRLNKYIRGEENSLKEWNDSLNNALEKKDCDNQYIINEKVQRKKKKKIVSEAQRPEFLQNLKVEKIDKYGQKHENVLLSLIFQLNQLLMVLNNPMLFPHKAYAERFNQILNEVTKGAEDGQQK